MDSEKEMRDLRRHIAWKKLSLPTALHPLLPFVEKFAIDEKAARIDFIKKQSDTELQKLCETLEANVAGFEAYLGMQPEDVGRWDEIPFRFLVFRQACSEAHDELYVCRKVSKGNAA